MKAARCRPGLGWGLALWAGPLVAALAAPPTPSAPVAATAAQWATARCVAALDAQADELAAQVKAGRADLKPLLLARLKAGGAWLGDAYLHGERDEGHAKALLHAAQAEQRALGRAELQARQNRCAAEGLRLLADANPVSQAVVSRLAQRRMRKLLQG